MCLKFFDTHQEKKIGAGVSWPFKKLKPFECLISEDYATRRHRKVKVDDKIEINLLMGDFWNVLRHEFN